MIIVYYVVFAKNLKTLDKYYIFIYSGLCPPPPRPSIQYSYSSETHQKTSIQGLSFLTTEEPVFSLLTSDPYTYTYTIRQLFLGKNKCVVCT